MTGRSLSSRHDLLSAMNRRLRDEVSKREIARALGEKLWEYGAGHGWTGRNREGVAASQTTCGPSDPSTLPISQTLS